MTRVHALRLDHGRRMPSWLRAPALLLAGALAGCGALALYAFQLADTAADLQQRAQERERAASATPAPRRTPVRGADALAEERLAGQVRAELATPWERLFGAIEGAAGPDVSLLSLAPLPGREQLNLGGEARNMGALLAFLKRLQGGGAYSRVYLREHHVDPADPQQPVRFSMELKWERGT